MNTFIWLCAAAAVGIFGVILYSVATFGGARERGARYRRGAFVETLWALVPILIVIAAAWPSLTPHEEPAPFATNLAEASF